MQPLRAQVDHELCAYEMWQLQVSVLESSPQTKSETESI
jgi:hypothetical protein